MNLSILIPCYNEVANIPKLREELTPVVTRLPGLSLPDHESIDAIEVIFVDDGSVDHTWRALHDTFAGMEIPNLSFRFERHDVNRGLGAALRTGFRAVSGDIILTTDSDGTYHHTEIPHLLQQMTPTIDIVTASPYHPDGTVVGVPNYRLILSRGASSIYRLVVDRQFYTYTALFRAYRRKVIESVSFKSNGYLAGTELMVKALLIGYQVAEYPAALHRRVYGVSKAKLARTILAHLKFQGQVILHRLRLFSLVDEKQQLGDQQWV